MAGVSSAEQEPRALLRKRRDTEQCVKAGREKRTPWSYRPGTTPLHRCPAGIKLIFLLAFSALPLFGLPFAAGAALFILIGAFFAGINPRSLLSGAIPLTMTLVVLTAFRAFGIDEGIRFDPAAAREGLLLASGILVCFAAASLFFAVTTTTEIRKALAAVETTLFRRQSRVSLALALMLGFLPRFFECWENAGNAARARCCRGGIRRVAVILPLVTECMIETAAETAEALESRGLT